MSGKLWDSAICDQFFWQAIWEILVYIFQTPHQIFVTFGMEVVLLVFMNQFDQKLAVFAKIVTSESVPYMPP